MTARDLAVAAGTAAEEGLGAAAALVDHFKPSSSLADAPATKQTASVERERMGVGLSGHPGREDEINRGAARCKWGCGGARRCTQHLQAPTGPADGDWRHLRVDGHEHCSLSWLQTSAETI